MQNQSFTLPTVNLEQSDNDLVDKFTAIVRLQDDGGREEGEDQNQLLCSLLGRLGLSRQEDTELGQVIHVIEDPLVLSIGLRLHVDVVDLVGDNKYITQKKIFFGKFVNFFWITHDFFVKFKMSSRNFSLPRPPNFCLTYCVNSPYLGFT